VTAIEINQEKTVIDQVIDDAGHLGADAGAMGFVRGEFMEDIVTEHMGGDFVAAGVAFPEPAAVGRRSPTDRHAFVAGIIGPFAGPGFFAEDHVGIVHGFPIGGNDGAGDEAIGAGDLLEEFEGGEGALGGGQRPGIAGGRVAIGGHGQVKGGVPAVVIVVLGCPGRQVTRNA
jgi:hypothetical protein